MGSSISKVRPSNESPDSIKSGFWAVIPLLIGTAPFGLIFGVFALDVGFGSIGAQSLSMFVFAGSSQFVGANLYGQGASLGIIFLATLSINLRHFLYGASLGPKLLRTSSRHRILMSFFLTDEGINLKWFPTEDMVEDFFTKTLQGTAFTKNIFIIMNKNDLS